MDKNVNFPKNSLFVIKLNQNRLKYDAPSQSLSSDFKALITREANVVSQLVQRENKSHELKDTAKIPYASLIANFATLPDASGFLNFYKINFWIIC